MNEKYTAARSVAYINKPGLSERRRDSPSVRDRARPRHPRSHSSFRSTDHH